MPRTNSVQTSWYPAAVPIVGTLNGGRSGPHVDCHAELHVEYGYWWTDIVLDMIYQFLRDCYSEQCTPCRFCTFDCHVSSLHVYRVQPRGDPILHYPQTRRFFETTLFPAECTIPTSDSHAYDLNLTHRWVYNKLTISKLQNLTCDPYRTTPSTTWVAWALDRR